jgi:hypothetical protein
MKLLFVEKIMQTRNRLAGRQENEHRAKQGHHSQIFGGGASDGRA